MKQKFTNEEVRLYTELMQKLREGGKLGFAIAKNSRKMREEIREYQEKRNELLRKHGTIADARTGRYELTPEQEAAFKEELAPYAEMECDVEVTQISEDVFSNGTLNNLQMDTLMWMVQGEGKSAEKEKPKMKAKA